MAKKKLEHSYPTKLYVNKHESDNFEYGGTRAMKDALEYTHEEGEVLAVYKLVEVRRVRYVESCRVLEVSAP
jgi:hypothetical protein